MKFSQALALGATLIAQTQACTRVHLRENGFRYDVTFFLDNQAPIVMTAVDDLNYKDPNNAATSVRINRGSDISGSFTYRDLFHSVDLFRESPLGATVSGTHVYCLWDNVNCGGYNCGT